MNVQHHLAMFLAATLAAALVLLSFPRRARLPDPGETAPGEVTAERAVLLRLRPVLALTALAGGWAMVGGYAGMVAGPAAAAAVWVVLGRTENPAAVRRREQLVRDLPVAVDLLGSCLDAGAPPETALTAVADAVGGAVGEELWAIHHRLVIGVAPDEVWHAVARHPQLGPLGRSIGRAHETGASVSEAVRRLAAELRHAAAAEVEARARSIEVKAAAPLGLCLLPAFMLLGVVPMVVGVFSSMDLFG